MTAHGVAVRRIGRGLITGWQPWDRAGSTGEGCTWHLLQQSDQKGVRAAFLVTYISRRHAQQGRGSFRHVTVSRYCNTTYTHVRQSKP
jgi:hypothetical protein